MLRVGLTGGIGSGKSLIARILRILEVPVFEADAEATPDGAQVQPMRLSQTDPLANVSGATNAITFYLDPDGEVTDGTVDGPGKSVMFYLYYNGLLRTRGTVEPNTCSSATCLDEPKPNNDPPWFSWN